MLNLTIKIILPSAACLLVFSAISYANTKCISALSKEEKILHDIFFPTYESSNSKKLPLLKLPTNPKISKLIRAVYSGDTQKVKRIVKSGRIDINGSHIVLGYTPLIMAVGEGHYDIVDILLNAEGIDVDKPNEAGITPLMEAVTTDSSNNIKIAKTLIEHKTDVNKKDIHGWTALMWAAYRGESEMVKLLVNVEGININSTNNEKETSLTLAINNNNTEVIEILRQY